MSQQKIQEIVTKYGAEIYTKPKQFIAIISDYFPNDKLGALLKKVIEESSKDIYKFKDLSGNELTINYTKTLDMISNKTFIAKDVILPALDLLCIGLEIDITTITKPAQPAPVVTVKPDNIAIIDGDDDWDYIPTPKTKPIPKSAPKQNDIATIYPNIDDDGVDWVDWGNCVDLDDDDYDWVDIPTTKTKPIPKPAPKQDDNATIYPDDDDWDIDDWSDWGV